MTKTAKFTFEYLDANRDGLRASAHAPAKKLSFTDAQIKEIQHAAYSEGLLAGEDAALLRIQKRSEEILEQIAAQYSDLMSSVNDQICFLRGQSAELALLIAKKLTPALIAKTPTVEIEKLFLECVANLNAEPRIVIRVDEALIDDVKDKIDHLSRKAGYPGRVVLIGKPDALPAECQIEWADGGVTFRSPEQLAHIDQMIAEYVSGAAAKDRSDDI